VRKIVDKILSSIRPKRIINRTTVCPPLKMAQDLRNLARNESSHSILLDNVEIRKGGTFPFEDVSVFMVSNLGIVKLLENKDLAVRVATLQALEFLAQNPRGRKKLLSFQEILDAIEETESSATEGKVNESCYTDFQKNVGIPGGATKSLKHKIGLLLAEKKQEQKASSRKYSSRSRIRTKIEIQFSYLESEEDAEDIRAEMLFVEGVISVTCNLETQIITLYCKKKKGDIMPKVKRALNKLIEIRRSRTPSQSDNRSGSVSSDPYNYIPDDAVALEAGKIPLHTDSQVGYHGDTVREMERAKKRKLAIERRNQAKASYMGSLMSYFF